MTAQAKQTIPAIGRQRALDAGGGNVKKFFEHNKGAIAAVLPRHISLDRMLRIALGALRTTPALKECTVQSLFGAVVACSELGLEANTPLGQAYLVPFRNKKKGITEVQVIPGYRGLIDLARRSGQIVSISAQAVREADDFTFAYGLDDELRHVPARHNRGNIIGFYAVAKLRNGGHQFEVLWREQVDEVMRASQSGGRHGPWKDHYEEMGRKTAIRRLFKYLPVSIENAREVGIVQALDDIHDNQGDQHMDTALSGEYEVVQEDYEPTVEPEATRQAEEPTEQPAQQPHPDPADLLKALDECASKPKFEEMWAQVSALSPADQKKAAEIASRKAWNKRSVA